jgi:IS30 family transposase
MYALLKRSVSQKAIARDMEVSQSTISRELRRNTGKPGHLKDI